MSLGIHVLLAAVSLGIPTAIAQEGGGAAEPQGIESTEEEEELERNHFSLFTGGSHQGSENGFSLGGEYEFRFNRLVGAGVMGEYAWGFREEIFVFPVYFHPVGGLVLAAGPGLDRPTGATSEGEGEGGEEEGTAFLFRVAVQYEFELGKGFSIGPIVAFDFVNGDQVLVYGMGFAYAF